METGQFQTLLTVARVGNITQASELLHLTQPAVSRQIQALEATYGVTLFDRTGRGMQLTDAGRLLLGYAERCLAVLEDASQVMADVRAGATGKLVIGVGGTHPMYELPEWVHTFTQRFPAVEISIRTGRSQEIISAIAERQLDLAFVRVPITQPGVHHIELFTEPILLIAHPGRFPAGGSLSPEVLQNLPLILFPRGESFRAQIDRALGALEINPRIRMETDSVEEIKRFAARGIGLAFLPAAAVAEDLAASRLIHLEVEGMPPLTRRTSLIYREDRYQSSAMREFIALVTA